MQVDNFAVEARFPFDYFRYGSFVDDGRQIEEKNMFAIVDQKFIFAGSHFMARRALYQKVHLSTGRINSREMKNAPRQGLFHRHRIDHLIQQQLFEEWREVNSWRTVSSLYIVLSYSFSLIELFERCLNLSYLR